MEPAFDFTSIWKCLPKIDSVNVCLHPVLFPLKTRLTGIFCFCSSLSDGLEACSSRSHRVGFHNICTGILYEWPRVKTKTNKNCFLAKVPFLSVLMMYNLDKSALSWDLGLSWVCNDLSGVSYRKGLCFAFKVPGLVARVLLFGC